MVSALPGHPELESYCFDCECIVPDRSPLCISCERHRLDDHLAELVVFELDDLEDEDDVPGWCHGAGPEGQNVERLNISPYPLRWEETYSYRIRPRKRRSRRRPQPEV